MPLSATIFYFRVADGAQTPGSEFSPYVSPDLAANREKLESDLAMINADSKEGSNVRIFNGELSEKAQKEYTNLKRAANNLNSVAGDNFNIAIVNADADFNGVTVKGKNIYISAELIESGNWAPTLIHELTHFTEGSPEYNKFARFLLSSNPAAAAYKASELTAEGNAYGFTRENVERAFGSEPQVQYSKGGTPQNVITIEADSELAKRIESSDKSKYTVIRDYLVEKFYGQEFTLSDGRRAIMDKRDAQELSHKADDIKTAELANLKEIVEKAELFSKTDSVRHNKFNQFLYYSAIVNFENHNYYIVVNVGRAKNDGKYHIYDITKDKRAANQSTTGLSRPVGNAIKNSSSVDSIPESSENVNTELKNKSDSVRDGDFASELIASIAEDSVGTDGAFIDRLVRGNESLAAKVINKIHDAVAALESRKSPEARAEYKRLKNAEKLFMRAVESTGKRYVDGKIVADDEEKKLKYSLKINPQNGEKFVVVEPDSIKKLLEFDGNTMAAKVRNYLKQFRGAVLPLGSTDKVYMRREGEGEYTNPAKSLSDEAYQGKLSAASEFENLLLSSKFVRHEPDNGRHSDAVRGWNYYELTYLVPVDNNMKAYKAEIQIKLVSKGDCFYDITKIEDVTDGTAGQALIKAAGSVDKSSTNSIPENSENVNTKLQYSKKSSVQSAKKFANENNEKVYTKKEIRAMLKNVSRDLLSFEDGDFGLVGQNQTKVVEKFFNAFNVAKDDGRRYAVCHKRSRLGNLKQETRSLCGGG